MENSLSVTFDHTVKLNKNNYQLYRFNDIVLAIILLIPSSIITLMVFVLFKIKIKDRGPFFYKGRRLGLNKVPFNCFKIRTLVKDAEKKIGSNIYQGHENLDLFYGKFLRKTRLDELPQLVNIIRGEMSFIGPRPVRLSQYERYIANIPGFDKFFNVRPGLTGYSQFLTPSGTNKKIRARIDTIFYCKSIPESKRLLFILWTATRCLYHIFNEVGRFMTHRHKMIINRQPLRDKRLLHREYPKNAIGFLMSNINNKTRDKVSIADVSHSTMRIITDFKLIDTSSFDFIIDIDNYKYKKRRTNRVECIGKILECRPIKQDHINNNYCYIIQYQPKTDFHRYIIDKYMLKDSIA